MGARDKVEEREREEEKMRVINKADTRKMVITYARPLQSPAIPTA